MIRKSAKTLVASTLALLSACEVTSELAFSSHNSLEAPASAFSSWPEEGSTVDWSRPRLAQLRIDIAPDEKTISAQSFPVVVTNDSAQPLNVWREWCSWGYQNVSFKLIDSDGVQAIIHRPTTSWNANFPMPALLLPGEHHVRLVNLFDGSWLEGDARVDPKRWAGRRKLRLQAVFTIPPSRDDTRTEAQLWNGTAESPVREYHVQVSPSAVEKERARRLMP
jgi:hypothetical protein